MVRRAGWRPARRGDCRSSPPSREWRSRHSSIIAVAWSNPQYHQAGRSPPRPTSPSPSRSSPSSARARRRRSRCCWSRSRSSTMSARSRSSLCSTPRASTRWRSASRSAVMVAMATANLLGVRRIRLLSRRLRAAVVPGAPERRPRDHRRGPRRRHRPAGQGRALLAAGADRAWHPPVGHVRDRPLFGFVSAGVALTGGVGALLAPLPLAIMLGLFLGKQIGVFGAIRAGRPRSASARGPKAPVGRKIYGAAVLTGIGFTMSLFIAGLAFPGHPDWLDEAKIGILAGSVLSALAGWLILSALAHPRDRRPRRGRRRRPGRAPVRAEAARPSGFVAEQLELDPRVLGDSPPLVGAQHFVRRAAVAFGARPWRAAALRECVGQAARPAPRAFPTSPRTATIRRPRPCRRRYRADN